MTPRYAVFGNPIAQSKSPEIHGAFAAALGQSIVYTRELAPIYGLRDTLRAFRANGGRGANITAPFKIDAFDLATHRSQNAQHAGAVNALKFISDEIHAENFDGVGLVNDIEKNLGVSLAGKRVLLLGAGGAARGAVLPLLAANIATLVIANRTVSRADALAKEFAPYGAVFGRDPNGVGSSFDLILNSTSASLSNACPSFAARAVGPNTLAYELAYGKGLTPFLRMTKAQGAGLLADGAGMLVEQAALAYEWWFGVRPTNTKAVIESIRVPIQ